MPFIKLWLLLLCMSSVICLEHSKYVFNFLFWGKYIESRVLASELDGYRALLYMCNTFQILWITDEVILEASLSIFSRQYSSNVLHIQFCVSKCYDYMTYPSLKTVSTSVGMFILCLPLFLCWLIVYWTYRCNLFHLFYSIIS